jgi:hypothetical protein
MNIFGLLKNNYFSLFVKREGKVVLGKSYSNLWLLVGVLTATFLAISFSNASLKYLKHKMDDPFINWVDIKNDYYTSDNDFLNLEKELALPENKERFHYKGYQADFYDGFSFYAGDPDKNRSIRIRFFQDMKSELVEAILSKDNVVRNARIKDLSVLDSRTIGIIITREALARMGCNDTPTFLYYCAGADDYPEMYGFDAHMPIPVIGIVEQLPGNVDAISSSYLYEQIYCTDYPLVMLHESYAQSINYFVPSGLNKDNTIETLYEIIGDYSASYMVDDDFYAPEIIPYKEGYFLSIKSTDYYPDYQRMSEINAEVLDALANKGVYRVYRPEFGFHRTERRAFLSVNFSDLDKITEFEKFVSEFNVRIEMSQINAKENFNAVSTMANILSWAIIVFAIICIILFIVNLLQSYFQKVKRNLGTFKAFGMGNYELISVYTLIMAATILVSIVVSLAAVWLSQGVLELLNITRDEVFGYLSLWNGKTVSAILVIIFASVFTVYTVMNRLLRSTPGDLIYDR